MLSFRRFYYDIAGIEGVEWPALFLSFAWMGLVPTLPIQFLILILGRR